MNMWKILYCAVIAVGVCQTAHAVDYTWDGNGSVDNSGNWSNPLNWDLDSGYPDGTNDTADLQATLSSARYITNDVVTTVGTIIMEDDANHHLVLGANLTVDTIDGVHDKYKSHIDLNGYTLTLGQTLGTGNYTPALDGDGLFVKVSSGTSTLQGEDEYTGSMIVSNGTLNFRAYAWDTTTLLTVIDGATALLMEPGPSFPTNILINGQGYNGAGALNFVSTSDECASDITLLLSCINRRMIFSSFSGRRFVSSTRMEWLACCK